MDPYQRLAAEIITQAVDDFKSANRRITKCGKNAERAIAKGDRNRLSIEADQLRSLQITQSRLLDFFEGDWCDGLCEFVGLNHNAVLDKIRKV
jgi:hypothetical protein